ncbi:hypothetical protein SALBM217S_07943 [Streptomyces griseoloalbus]
MREEAEDEGTRLVLPGGGQLVLADGQASVEFSDVVYFDLALDYRAATRIALSHCKDTSARTVAEATGLFQALGKKVSVIGDIPGMIVARTVARIIDLAVEAVAQGVATEEDVDIAMRLGVNYPLGPFEWSRRLGRGWAGALLDEMHEIDPSGRYAPSLALYQYVRGPREGGHPMTTAKRDTYTPETLLSVAVQVFNERGYDGTSMEHLSRAAGISKSSIYHHVAGKEELLRRAVSRALDGLFGILDEDDARVGRPAARLEYVVRRMVEVLIAELPYVTLLLRVRGNTDTERWALERRREFDHRVAELLKAAAADGDVREDIEVRLVTRLVFGMINSIVEWYRPDGRGMNEREVADAVAQLAFSGLRRAGDGRG